MKIRYYLLGPAFVALFTPALLATPGCSADTCQGASAKICSKACDCGSCTVNGIKFPSSAACSLALGGQCDPTKHDVDWAACAAALDTAMCLGGSGSSSASSGGSTNGIDGGTGGGTGAGGGSSASGGQGVLAIPEECSAPIPGGAGGAGGAGSTGSTSASSSSSK